MSDFPGFGVLLNRLADRRGLNVRELSGRSGLPEMVLEEVIGGAMPQSLFLRRLSPALGLHAADLFVIAGARVPEDLAPLDDKGGSLIPSLSTHFVRLSSDQRGRLLEFVRSLPQRDRSGTVPALKSYEQYPPGLGGILLGMLGNRNLNLWNSAKALTGLTDGRVCLSSSTVRLIGIGRKVVTPELLDAFVTALDIHASDLVLLGGVAFPLESLSSDPATTDAAKLIWEARRLSVEQIRQARREVDSMLLE